MEEEGNLLLQSFHFPTNKTFIVKYVHFKQSVKHLKLKEEEEGFSGILKGQPAHVSTGCARMDSTRNEKRMAELQWEMYQNKYVSLQESILIYRQTDRQQATTYIEM